MILPVNETTNVALPSEKLLLLILLGNACQIIWTLIKAILESKAKKADQTSERLEHITRTVDKLSHQVESLMDQDHPTHEEIMRVIRPEIELMIYKATHKQ